MITDAINGELTNDYSGYSISNAGDVNNDGYDDIIIGAYAADALTRTDAGKSYVLFGSASGVPNINLSTLTAGTSSKKKPH